MKIEAFRAADRDVAISRVGQGLGVLRLGRRLGRRLGPLEALQPLVGAGTIVGKRVHQRASPVKSAGSQPVSGRRSTQTSAPAASHAASHA